MKPTTKIILIAILVCSMAGVAKARIRTSGVKVSLDGPRRAALVGELFEGTLVFRSFGDHVVDDINIEGDGWRIMAQDPDPRIMMSKGEFAKYAFTATPTSKGSPLTVHWSRDGKPDSRTFDLSREAFENEYSPMAMTFSRDEILDISAKEPPVWERLVPPTESAPKVKVEDGDKNTTVLIEVEGSIAAYYEPTQNLYVPRGLWVKCESSSMIFPQYQYADANGHFSFNVGSSVYDPTPDIQISYYAANDHAVVNDDDFWDDTWGVSTEIFMDVTESHLDLGILLTSSGYINQAIYIAETLQRSWEYYNDERGFNVSSVEAHFPDDDGETYWSDSWPDDGIFISRSRGWAYWSITHEYGHHWANDFIGIRSFDYNNGQCDEPDPGHCGWCEEEEAVVWNEGIANFIGALAMDYIAETFSYPHPEDLPAERDMENVSYSQGCEWTPDPYNTEGFFAAQLMDLADMDTDCDISTDGYCDVAEGWADEVFEVLTTPCSTIGYGRYVESVMEFGTCFPARYPDLAEGFWETSRNCGLEFDFEPPGGVNFNFRDPALGIPSTDHTITVGWSIASDNLSGIEGYSVYWSSAVPGSPDTTMDAPGTEVYAHSGPLPAGTYWFNIRAVDRAGNWDTGFSSTGPFILMDGEGSDLRYDVRPGWDYEVVPTSNNDSTHDNAQVWSLAGGTSSTYWNVAGENIGDTGSVATSVEVSVDGEAADSYGWPPILPGSRYWRNNQGPITVPAGRHMFGVFHDSDEVNSETNESNNFRAGQWAWRPTTVLPVDDLSLHDAPTPPAAGFEYFGWDQPAFWNCDGYKITDYLFFQAVYIYPNSIYNRQNYDLRIFGPEILPESGYLYSIGESLRPKGYLDAVLVHGLNQGLDDCHIGVYNWEEGTGTVPYMLNRVQDEYIGDTYGTYSSALSAGAMMKIWSFEANEPVTLKLSTESGAPAIYLGYFDDSFATGGLMDATQVEMARPGDPALINVFPNSSGLCAAVAWRELDGNLPINENVYLEIQPIKPDIVAQAPDGWVAPLVPYPNHDPVYPWPTLTAPPHLVGSSNSTYCYYGGVNDSPLASSGFGLRSYVDGDIKQTFTRASLDPESDFRFTAGSSIWVWGGRHVLALELDYADAVDEEFENNNRYARQWAWSPASMGVDAADDINYLPNVLAGADQMIDGNFSYNCCAWQTPSFSQQATRFVSFTSLCDAETDVDIRLYPTYSDVELGFTAYDARSSLSFGETDFIIADLVETGGRSFDVGLLEMDGNGDAYLEVDEAGSTAIDGPGSFVDTMASSEITTLYRIQLNSGEQEIRLTPAPGSTVDLGFSLRVAGTDYVNRADLPPNLNSWLAAPNEDEVIQITTTGTTECALLVWRTGAEQAGTACQFTISVGDGASSVGGMPSVARLYSAAPNPFNPQTTIRFDIPEERQVHLRIFDLSGRVVRNLLSGELYPAGSHAIEWNGKDLQGRQVASGAYFYQIKANGFVETKRMLLVK
jgi:FlgD Ig-like domain